MEKHVVDADNICSGCGWSSTTSRRRLPCEAHLTLLEESARQGCPRCDLLHKAVKLYEDQWPGIESTAVVVRCHQQGRTGTGTRVWWPREHGRPWEPLGQRKAWEQSGVEIFSQVGRLGTLTVHCKAGVERGGGGELTYYLCKIEATARPPVAATQSPRGSNVSNKWFARLLEGHD